MTYCLLINNKHYLTYGVNAQSIVYAEFNILNNKYNFATNIQIEDICGINYLCFDADNIDNFINKISELTFVIAIFEKVNDLLKPINKNSINYVNQNISSILKYSGKTNEYFTKLMINIASNLIEKENNINLLDPICGKGTTLFEGLVKGYNCYGVEIAPKVVDETAIFLRKFLELEKYKFKLKNEKFSGANKSFKAEKYIFDIKQSKDDEESKRFEVISCNTLYVDKIYKKDFFDIIIGDLPYGVKHSNITNEKQNSFTRSPKELIEKSIDVWCSVLNKNGVMIMSWNTFLLSKDDFKQIVINKGYKVLENDNLNSFVHRVDQAINRDLIVIKK